MSKKDIIQLIILLVIGISGTIGIITITRKNKEKALNNPPTISYVEEDAENYLYSKMIKVYKVDKIDDYTMIFFVEDCDTNSYYKVIYKFKFSIGNYDWEYSHYIPILNMVKERKTANENNIQ